MTQYLERPKYEFVEINNKMLLWVRTNSGSFVKEVFFFAFDPFSFHGHQKWGHVAQRARAATDLYRFWWKNLVEALSQQTCIFFSRFSFLYACPTTTCKKKHTISSTSCFQNMFKTDLDNRYLFFNDTCFDWVVAVREPVTKYLYI